MRLFEQGGFTRCQVCEHCAGEHRQHSDSFLEFVDEMVEIRQRQARPDRRVLPGIRPVLRRTTAGKPKATPRSASRSCGSPGVTRGAASGRRPQVRIPRHRAPRLAHASRSAWPAGFRSRSYPCPATTDASGKAAESSEGTLPSRPSKIRPSKTGSLGRRLTLENTGFLINPS